MKDFEIGDLVLVVEITAFSYLRDPDVGKFGVVVDHVFDWVVRSDVLYIQIEGKKKGFYPHEVEIISKWND